MPAPTPAIWRRLSIPETYGSIWHEYKSRSLSHLQPGRWLILVVPFLTIFFMVQFIQLTGSDEIAARVELFRTEATTILSARELSPCPAAMDRTENERGTGHYCTSIKAFVVNHVTWQVSTVLFWFTCIGAMISGILTFFYFANRKYRNKLLYIAGVLFFVLMYITSMLAEDSTHG